MTKDLQKLKAFIDSAGELIEKNPPIDGENHPAHAFLNDAIKEYGDTALIERIMQLSSVTHESTTSGLIKLCSSLPIKRFTQEKLIGWGLSKSLEIREACLQVADIWIPDNKTLRGLLLNYKEDVPYLLVYKTDILNRNELLLPQARFDTQNFSFDNLPAENTEINKESYLLDANKSEEFFRFFFLKVAPYMNSEEYGAIYNEFSKQHGDFKGKFSELSKKILKLVSIQFLHCVTEKKYQELESLCRKYHPHHFSIKPSRDPNHNWNNITVVITQQEDGECLKIYMHQSLICSDDIKQAHRHLTDQAASRLAP